MVGTNPIPSDIPTCDKCGPISIFPLSLSLLRLWASHQSGSPEQERERGRLRERKAVKEEGIKTSREGEGEGEEGSGGGRKEKLPEEEMLHNSGVDVHVVLTCHFAGMCPTPPNLFIAFVCHLSHSISPSPSHSLTAAITPISLSLVPHQKCR